MNYLSLGGDLIMHLTVRRFLCLGFVLVALLSVTLSCRQIWNDTSDEVSPKTPTEDTAFEIVGPAYVSVGGAISLVPVYASKEAVGSPTISMWSSSQSGFVDLSRKDGTVKGVKVGRDIVIIATSSTGETATHRVTVFDIDLEKNEDIVFSGENLILEPHITPSGVTAEELGLFWYIDQVDTKNQSGQSEDNTLGASGRKTGSADISSGENGTAILHGKDPGVVTVSVKSSDILSDGNSWSKDIFVKTLGITTADGSSVVALNREIDLTAVIYAFGDYTPELPFSWSIDQSQIATLTENESDQGGTAKLKGMSIGKGKVTVSSSGEYPETGHSDIEVYDLVTNLTPVSTMVATELLQAAKMSSRIKPETLSQVTVTSIEQNKPYSLQASISQIEDGGVSLQDIQWSTSLAQNGAVLEVVKDASTGEVSITGSNGGTVLLVATGPGNGEWVYGIHINEVNTVVGEDYGIYAEDFVIDEALLPLDDSKILELSESKAWSITDGSEEVLPVVEDASALAGATEGDTYDVVLAVDKDGETKRTIRVTVSGDNTIVGSEYGIFANNFAISLPKAEESLGMYQLVVSSKAKAWKLSTGEAVSFSSDMKSIPNPIESGEYSIPFEVLDDQGRPTGIVRTITVTIYDLNDVMPVFIVKNETFTFTPELDFEAVPLSELTWSSSNSTALTVVTEANGDITLTGSDVEREVFVNVEAPDGGEWKFPIRVVGEPFVLMYDMPAATELQLPLSTEGSVYDLYVDWGDNTDITRVIQGTDAVHTYESAGSYEVTIYGDLRFGDYEGTYTDVYGTSQVGDGKDDGLWGGNNFSSNTHLTAVKSWGDAQFIHNRRLFSYIENNVTVPADTSPYLEGAIAEMFLGSKSFNQPIGHWDMSKVTSMRQLFWESTSPFDQNISDWDVTNVQNMGALFLDSNQYGAYDGIPFNNGEADLVGLTNWDLSTAIKGGIKKATGEPPRDGVTIAYFGIRDMFAVTLFTNPARHPNNCFDDDGYGGFSAGCGVQHDALRLTYNIGEQKTLKLPLRTSGEVYELYVFWGDDVTYTTVIEASAAEHTYKEEGEFEVVIYGDLRFGDYDNDGEDDGSWGGDQFTVHNESLTKVTSWGNAWFINNPFGFDGAVALAEFPDNPYDVPLKVNGNSEGFFRGAAQINPDLSNWSFEEVTNGSSMFEGTTNLAGTGLYRRSFYELQTADNMFKGSGVTGQGMTKWMLPKVSSITGMFEDTSNLTSKDLGFWELPLVKNMDNAFRNSAITEGPQTWKIGQKIDSRGVCDLDGISIQDMFVGSQINANFNKWSVSNALNVSVDGQKAFDNTPMATNGMLLPLGYSTWQPVP